MSKKDSKKTTAVDAAADVNKQIAELTKFKESLKDMSMKELEELEQKVIKETDEHNEARMNLKFKLPAKNYKEAMTAIRDSLETITMQWQYALGLKTMYEFFDPENRKEHVDFPMLDSMLRTLGQAQLKGYKQWCNVVTISEYFEPIRDAYAQAGSEVYIDAERHNAIINELQLHTAQKEVTDAAKADNAAS